ncbi:unnamed protein product, partial [Mesorhabditis belari]|uniref:Glycerol kinase n=1 Tax=Mesorhabditis belari TaxID=2138241 RepID=A0AAF3J8U9_9BILA
MIKNYVIAVDIGTTTIRACLYDDRCQLVTVSQDTMEILRLDPRTQQAVRSRPKNPSAADILPSLLPPLLPKLRPSKKSKPHLNQDVGAGATDEMLVEIDPERMFQQFTQVIKNVLEKVPDEKNIRLSMGLCCLRNSFILWDKMSLKPVSRFVVWSDTRARKRCAEWNASWTIKGMNIVGGLLYKLTRKPRYKAAQIFKFIGGLVSHRLMVTIEESDKAQELARLNRLGFGCIESWLLWKLSEGKVLLSETGNTSSTGMYDPFIADYNFMILKLIGFPTKLLNPLCESAKREPFLKVDTKFFGHPINVHCLLADQQAALYGVGGVRKGDVKISLGTGTFVDLNTGSTPHASMSGTYPLVGWRLNGKNTYIAEGNDHDTAVLLGWAQSAGLFDDVTKTSAMAESTHNPGVYFVPAFGGLQTPINDDNACCGFLGLRPKTTKEQMVRAILEAIAFRVYQIWSAMSEEFGFKVPPRVRICGGVANNDFVCQCVSSLLNLPMERVTEGGTAASKGVALMTGLMQGLWTEDEIEAKIGVEKVFQPDPKMRETLLATFRKWKHAVDRCSNFYD